MDFSVTNGKSVYIPLVKRLQPDDLHNYILALILRENESKFDNQKQGL